VLALAQATHEAIVAAPAVAEKVPAGHAMHEPSAPL